MQCKPTARFRTPDLDQRVHLEFNHLTREQQSDVSILMRTDEITKLQPRLKGHCPESGWMLYAFDAGETNQIRTQMQRIFNLLRIMG